MPSHFFYIHKLKYTLNNIFLNLCIIYASQKKKNRLFMRLFQIKVELTGLPVFLFFSRLFLCSPCYFVVYLSFVFLSFLYITILCIICASRKGARLLFLAFLYVFSDQLLQVCVGRGSFFVYFL